MINFLIPGTLSVAFTYFAVTTQNILVRILCFVAALVTFGAELVVLKEEVLKDEEDE